MKKVCLIGYPAKHSLSYAIHTYWLEKYGIDGKYETREILPENFDEFFLNLEKEGYVGCNVTVPFKERAFELVINKNIEAIIQDIETECIGAINTAVIKYNKYKNEKDFLVTNTDHIGFISNIEKCIPDFDFTKKAVILGAGGASRAVICALLDKLSTEIIITNRSIENAKKLKEYIKKTYTNSNITIIPWESRSEALARANLLVNTTSLGMSGQPPLDIDLSLLPKNALVTDIVYRPLITPILQMAKDRGNPIVDGLGMLLYQAVPGFNMWFREELDAKGIESVEVTAELRQRIEALL